MTQVKLKEGCISVKINGAVYAGFGQSSQWMPMYVPWLYPGTLNIGLVSKKPIIHYFTTIDTHFGRPCKIARCKINGVDAFIIFPPMAKDNRGRIEIGSEFNLRDKFSLTNGDIVEIEFV